MSRILAIITLTLAASFLAPGENGGNEINQTGKVKREAQSAPLAKVFRSVLAKVKNESKIPILLPSKLPASVNENKIRVVYGEGEPDGYEISLYYEPGCGNACFAGFFAAKQNAKLAADEADKAVRLAHGVKGYYTGKSCGVSCTPPQIEWMYRSVCYTIQFKVNGRNAKQDEASIIRMANTAIEAGPR
jgi:hypothetical protein